jgi:shikimate dehydrogenase
MHNAALCTVGLADWRYQLLPVPPVLFAETVRALPGAGFRGANVTIPHKRAALALANAPTAAALAIGAANTLTFDGPGRISADNTDAPALIASLPLAAAGSTALVLGAGGSARAAVWALLHAGAADVRVWNRTPARARELCAELGGMPVDRAAPADLLVNCTSIGLADPDAAFTALPLTADGLRRYRCVVDLVYGTLETPLVRAARASAIPVVDGLALLVAQGALSFERFTGAAAPIDAMRAAVAIRPCGP